MKAIFFIILSYVPAAVSKPIIGSAQCEYIRDPVYIKTKGCGGFCSGIIKCIQSDTYYPFVVPAGCQADGDGKCPLPKKCYESEEKGKAFFIGPLFEYDRLYKTEKPKKQRTTGGSGATR